MKYIIFISLNIALLIAVSCKAQEDSIKQFVVNYKTKWDSENELGKKELMLKYIDIIKSRRANISDEAELYKFIFRRFYNEVYSDSLSELIKEGLAITIPESDLGIVFIEPTEEVYKEIETKNIKDTIQLYKYAFLLASNEPITFKIHLEKFKQSYEKLIPNPKVQADLVQAVTYIFKDDHHSLLALTYKRDKPLFEEMNRKNQEELIKNLPLDQFTKSQLLRTLIVIKLTEHYGLSKELRKYLGI